MKCSGHAARIGEMRNAYKMLVGNLKGGVYGNTIQKRILNTVWGVDLIYVAQDQWRALENTVMNLRVPNKVGNFFTAERLLAFEVGLCSWNLVAYTSCEPNLCSCNLYLLQWFILLITTVVTTAVIVPRSQQTHVFCSGVSKVLHLKTLNANLHIEDGCLMGCSAV
jgi:hypothetical protein